MKKFKINSAKTILNFTLKSFSLIGSISAFIAIGLKLGVNIGAATPLLHLSALSVALCTHPVTAASTQIALNLSSSIDSSASPLSSAALFSRAAMTTGRNLNDAPMKISRHKTSWRLEIFNGTDDTNDEIVAPRCDDNISAPPEDTSNSWLLEGEEKGEGKEGEREGEEKASIGNYSILLLLGRNGSEGRWRRLRNANASSSKRRDMNANYIALERSGRTRRRPLRGGGRTQEGNSIKGNNRLDKHLLERQYFYAQKTSSRKSLRKKLFFLSRHASSQRSPFSSEKWDEEDSSKSPLLASESSPFLPSPSTSQSSVSSPYLLPLASPSSSSSTSSSKSSHLASSPAILTRPLSLSTKFPRSKNISIFSSFRPSSIEANFQLSKSRFERQSPASEAASARASFPSQSFPSVLPKWRFVRQPSSPLTPLPVGEVAVGVPSTTEVEPSKAEIVLSKVAIVPSTLENVPSKWEVIPSKIEVAPSKGEVAPSKAAMRSSSKATIIVASPSLPSMKNTSFAIPDHVPASTEVVRVNVVDENPSLDVGPLMLLTVVEGSTARLPCSENPLSKEDSVRLILWYRNDTSRPLLSYDAREEQKPRRSDIFSMSKEAFQRRDFLLFYRSRWLESEPRISLGRGGESLILLDVRHRDHAEYRCTVHYKKLPSVTYRLQLLVTDKIANVNIYDAEGTVLSGNYGPFAEGAEISVLCKSNCTTNFKNLTWLIEGEVVSSSFDKDGNTSAKSALQLKLQKSFIHSTLTCRSTCQQLRYKGSIETSLVDNSIILDMVYVPEARLFVDAAKSKEALDRSDSVKGGGVQVLEGQTLAFVCLVRSNPKSYSVTWLINGQVFDIQGDHWTRENNSLTINKIKKQDSGLYTCLASNREGDGQSNAISIKVAYPPYCKGPNNKHFTIGRNSSIVLQCNVDAYPSKVTFSWRKTGAYPLPRNIFYPNVFSHDVMTDITLKNRVSSIDAHPELIELGPENGDDKTGNYPLPQGPPLPHFEDPKLPTRSMLTIVPDADHIGIICLARNEIGRTNTPCFFRISVVDSPDPPVGCHVNSVGISSLKVDCKLRTSPEDMLPSQQTPGLSPVRSPGIKGASVLEVWAKGNLVTNQTSDRGHWYVNKLPPDTDLRLRIYSLSTHVPSEPVVLFARTLPKDVGLMNALPGTKVMPTDYLDSLPSEEEDSFHFTFIIGSIIVGLILIFLIIVSGLFLVRLFIRRRRGALAAEEDRPCSIGEGDPWAAHSYPESYDTIATSPI